MAKIVVDNVSYHYSNKYKKIEALKNVSCSFTGGKIYSITGPSGSGKSTLLSLLAGLDVPKEGSIYIDEMDLSKKNRDDYRKNEASVVYQSFHLFLLLTAQENVMYPLLLNGVKRNEAKTLANQLISQVGLPDTILHQFPKMMSGGEQQRVAIARALASNGKILLADEPTGNLDSENETLITDLLIKLAHENDYTVIIVTHNLELAARTDVVYKMKDGILKSTK